MLPVERAGNRAAGRTTGRPVTVRRKSCHNQDGTILNSQREAIREILPQQWQGKLVFDYPMARATTLRVGGPATAAAFPASLSELQDLVQALCRLGIGFRAIGRGSNILVPDRGVCGVIVILGPQFGAIKCLREDKEQAVLEVEAGCGLGRLVNWCVDRGLSGFEFAVGIPGSVGGAIRMNAGAWGQEISEVLDGVSFLDRTGRIRFVEKKRLSFAYRCLDVLAGETIVGGTFVLRRAAKSEIQTRCRELMQRRAASQPRASANAGSFFKNPSGDAAGRLIEEAGLKGLRVGGAMVSYEHANFIVNTGGASAQDVLALMAMIQQKIWERSAVQLEPEVHIIGSELQRGNRCAT